MKKLLLLPFLILNFVFSYDFGFSNIKVIDNSKNLTHKILQGSNGYFYFMYQNDIYMSSFLVYKPESVQKITQHNPEADRVGFNFTDDTIFDNFYSDRFSNFNSKTLLL